MAEFNVKTLSDNKRRIEDELVSMTSKKTKLDEEQTKSQAEIAILKENSRKLKEQNEKLDKEKTNLDKQYRECKREKENARSKLKIGEGIIKTAEQGAKKSTKKQTKRCI